MDPDQTAPFGGVRAGSILFAIKASLKNKQVDERAVTKVVTEGLRVNS